MTKKAKIGRRAACAGMIGAGGSLLLGGSAKAARPRAGRVVVASPKTYCNADFYDAAGKFNEKAAKDAYFQLMQEAGYPISENVRKNLGVTDFALGRFTEVGLGCVVWVSDKVGNYASLEIFLLPNQIIAEHWHVPLEGEGVTAKMESWIVRWGTTFTYGEGKPTAKLGVKIPASEAKFLTVKHEKRLDVGEVTGISKSGEKHWQEAGPQGAIITEVSTYHTGAAVRFTNPKIKF
jgi:D-lyxose ketol-isomerase